jgi:AcrR family transcriptional regulator
MREIMSKRKLDTRVRREQIAEAALGIVASQGVRRLSIAAVARRVGLVPSGIYRHYRNKDQMLQAVLDLLEKRLLGIVEGAVSRSPDPRTQLEEVLMSHIRFIREGRAIPRMIFSEDAHGDNPERKKRILGILTAYLGRIGELVRRGQQQGSIRPELDPETVTMMFVGIIVPAAIRWHLSDGGFDVTRHARRAWPMFWAAVAAPPQQPDGVA